MSTFTKHVLSGSTHGRGILVVATAIASGTTIHTAGAGTDYTGPEDIITLFGYNSDTATRTLTLGWGGTTDPGDIITQGIPAKTGLTLLVADLPLRDSLVVVAAADAASKVVIFGYANRISP